MSDVEIRPTIRADLGALAEVLRQVYETDSYPVEGVDNALAWVDLPEALGQWTALSNGTPVGHIALLRPSEDDQGAVHVAASERAEIDDLVVVARLFVHPGHRGQGVASVLLDQAEAKAVELGRTAILDVIGKDTAAKSLYGSRGWKVVAQVDHPYGEGKCAPALVMKLEQRDAERQEASDDETRVRTGRESSGDSESGAGEAVSFEEAYREVPPIGSAWRWYDIPYRSARYFLRLKRLPSAPWLQRFLLRIMNFFIPFSEIDRARQFPALSLGRVSRPSDDESVTQSAIWAVEIFPPSHAQALVRLMKRNVWLAQKDYIGIAAYDWKIVLDARSDSQGTWWPVADFRSIDSVGYLPDAVQARLPEQFESIHLQARQIGTSLTAVVAKFVLTESAGRELDKAWKAHPRPRLVFRGWKRPKMLGGSSAWEADVHFARSRAHASARRWLSRHCRGYFAATPSQPLVDLLLFDAFDPLADLYSLDPEVVRASECLGLDFAGFIMKSPQLPGLALNQVDNGRLKPKHLNDVWAVYGRRDTVGKRTAETRAALNLDDSDAAIGFLVDRKIAPLLIAEALTKHQHLLARRIRGLRDLARLQHSRFKASAVTKLRKEILRTSLDIPWAYRDAREFWDLGGASRELSVHADDVYSRQHPVVPDASYDVMDAMRQRSLGQWQELERDDTTYRDVLTTAASLGAAATSTRLAVWSIVVASAATVVALVTLYVTMQL